MQITMRRHIALIFLLVSTVIFTLLLLGCQLLKNTTSEPQYTTTIPSTTATASNTNTIRKTVIPPSTDTSNYANIFNEYRQSQGCTPLEFTEDLNRIALLRLAEIQLNFSHNSRGNYNRHLAENIVKVAYNNQDALTCWENSYLHNANMLNTDYRYTGYAIGGGYAVQVFSEWDTINGEPQLPSGWYWTN